MVAEAVSLAAFAFGAGTVTFLAPCAYPLLPGYVSFYLGLDGSGSGTATGDGAVAMPDGAPATDERFLPARIGRAVGVGLLVSLGFAVVYAALAGVVVAVGAQVLAGISALELVVGALLIVLGTAFATGYTLPTPTVRLPERRRSSLSFVGFGVVYAAAAAGCTAPVFAAVALRALAAGPTASVLAFGAYAAGMAVPMIGVTVAVALGRSALLDRLPSPERIRRGAGALLVVAGVVQIWFFLFRFDGLGLLFG